MWLLVCYRRLIGKFLHLQIFRLDIYFVVHHLRQFLQQPTSLHLTTVHHVIMYFVISNCHLTKKQLTVTRSFAQAEYQGLAAVTSELIWIAQLLRDLSVFPKSPTLVFVTIRPESLLLPIQPFTSAPNTFRSIVILFVMRFMITSSNFFQSDLTLNLLICSLKHCLIHYFHVFYASWVFLMSQLEGEY